MRYAQNDIVSTPAYTAEQTLFCPGAKKMTFQVFNNPIFYQFGAGHNLTHIKWENEEFVMTPGRADLFRKADAIRIRTKLPIVGNSPVVHLEAIS